MHMRLCIIGAALAAVCLLAPCAATIPRVVMQTTDGKDGIPAMVGDNIRKFAKGWEWKVFNDSECVDFMRHHFDSVVHERFTSYTEGAFKADLFRYAYLYVMGGAYFDIKTELMVPLDWLFSEHAIYLVSSVFTSRTIYNGIIATPPRQPVFLDMVNYMVDKGPHPAAQLGGHFNLRHLFSLVAHCGPPTRDWTCSSTPPSPCILNNTRVFFMTEESKHTSRCHDGVDRHNLCMFAVYEGDTVFKIRYASYGRTWGAKRRRWLRLPAR